MRTLLVLVAVALCCEVAHAKPRKYYYSNNNANTVTTNSGKTSSYTAYIPSESSGSDQDRCQAEANYMAANNITGHVWGCIGRFEGVGYGSSPNCNTCTPSGGMNLTGDASAQGRNGMWYRVRSWR